MHGRATTDRPHRARAFLRLAMPASILLAAIPQAAPAGWDGRIGWGSDSLLHGRSLTGGEPAWFGHLRHDRDRWTIGIGAVGEHPDGQSRGAQLDLYLDHRWHLDEDWQLRAGLVHYESPWNRWNDELRYDELGLGLGWRGRWSLVLGHAPDLPYLQQAPDRYARGRASWIETGWHQPLGGGFSLDLGIGHADIRGIRYPRTPRVGLADYAYASAGLGLALGRLHLHAVLAHANRRGADYSGRGAPRTRVAVTASWGF